MLIIILGVSIFVAATLLIGFGVYWFKSKSSAAVSKNSSHQPDVHADPIPEKKEPVVFRIEPERFCHDLPDDSYEEGDEIAEDDNLSENNENDSDWESSDDVEVNASINFIIPEERSLIVVENPEEIQTNNIDSTEDEIEKLQSQGWDILKQLHHYMSNSTDKEAIKLEKATKFFEVASSAFNKAYRRLVLKYHPDKNPDATEEEKLECEKQTKAINGIYNDLTAKFDRFLRNEFTYNDMQELYRRSSNKLQDNLIGILKKYHESIERQNKLLEEIIEIQARHIEKTREKLARMDKRLNRLKRKLARDNRRNKQFHEEMAQMRAPTIARLYERQEQTTPVERNEHNNCSKGLCRLICKAVQPMAAYVSEAVDEASHFFGNFWKEAEQPVPVTRTNTLAPENTSAHQVNFDDVSERSLPKSFVGSNSQK